MERRGTVRVWETGLELGLWVPKELLERWVSKAAEEQLGRELVLGRCFWEDRVES